RPRAMEARHETSRSSTRRASKPSETDDMQTQVPFRGPTTPWSHIGRCLTLALAVAGCDGAEGPVTTTTEDGGTDTSTGEPEPPPPACLPGDETPTLELGNGEAGFMDSDAVTLVYGPQGGYHIVLGLRATYLDASASLSAS